MRYFADGDLTTGIKVAARPYPMELVLGEWHIVWLHVDGSERTTNYDEPNALLAMGMTISAIEPADKRKKLAHENFQVEFKFCQWGLEYQGRYNTDGLATKLTLVDNTTKDLVDADDDAVLFFGAVRDDQDFPFLSFGTSALPRDARLEHYQNMEFVAKKTDETGIQTLELTRNERLRLGYRMNEDGIFDDFLETSAQRAITRGDRNESYETLMRQFREYSEAREKTMEKLSALRTRMDQELLQEGISPQYRAPNRPMAVTNGATKRTSSGLAKVNAAAPASAAKSTPKTAATAMATHPNSAPAGIGRRRKHSAKVRESFLPRAMNGVKLRGEDRDLTNDQGLIAARTPPASSANLPNSQLNVADYGDEDEEESAVAGGAEEEEGEEADDDDEFDSTSVASSEPVNSHRPRGRARARARAPRRSYDRKPPNSNAFNPDGPPQRECSFCQTFIVIKNWAIHTSSLKHRTNVVTAEGDDAIQARTQTDGSNKRPRVSGPNGSETRATESSAASPGKLKRPSSRLLRGANATPMSA